MRIFKKTASLKHCLSVIKQQNKHIGFVPTMGALHEGHLSLIDFSIRNNDQTVVSIFVNPTQFNNKEDLNNYPKTLEKDLELLEKSTCDIVFIPSIEEMYATNIVSKPYSFDGIEHQMEGKFREGHFDGVATIVQSLFKIVMPTHAYFGEKDFQQLQIIKKLVEKEQIPVHIVGCPIFREKDGLAMSSRNTRLTKAARASVPFIYKTLKEATLLATTKTIAEVVCFVEDQFKHHPIITLEYFTIAEETTLKSTTTLNLSKKNRAFIAAFAEKIRLIDNLTIL